MMDDNPFLALFETAPAQSNQQIFQPVTTKPPSSLDDPKAKINSFYEKMFFCSTVNMTSQDKYLKYLG